MNDRLKFGNSSHNAAIISACHPLCQIRPTALLDACIHHSSTGIRKYGNTGLKAPRSRTAKRRQLYLKWLIQSIMLFDLGSVITLWLLPSILD
ncbi:hypothetical protein [Gluconobacter sphaericus]|uniref:hypothetical protein n=1 Tax=Gluconobacter sphaericus TaxID=574987 RepID=UPI00312B9143